MIGNDPAARMNAPLSTKDYQDVRRALWEVRPQWRNIGLALDFPLSKINEFKELGSFDKKFDEMVEVWLMLTYSTPTWGALVKALRDVTVNGGKPVAAEIEAKYGGQASQGDSIDGSSQVHGIPHSQSYSQDEEVPSTWKKKYFAYMDGEQTATDEVHQIIRDLDQDAFILNIGSLRCFRTSFPTKKEESTSVLASLRSEPPFEMAQKILQTRGNETDPFEFLPLMVICSRSVNELHAVLVALRRVLHPDRWAKLTDALYCLATLFFALWNCPKRYLPPRFHYYLYYSLTILERQPIQGGNMSSTSPSTFVQSAPSGVKGSESDSEDDSDQSYLSEDNSDSDSSSESSSDQHSTESTLEESDSTQRGKARESWKRKRPPPDLTHAPSKKRRVSAAQSTLTSTIISRQERKRKWEPLELKFTPEQMSVVNYPLKPGEVIRVMALAGTGKTSTLVKFAEKRPKWRFLHCSFNRSIKQDAKREFPDNVTAKTVHSLAFNALGVKKRFKKKFKNYLNVGDVEQYTSEPYHVLKTLENFIASDSEKLSEEHLSQKLYYCADERICQVLDDAKDIWKRMIDPRDRTVKITYDGYLKLYQLQKPTIKGCDCILIDEAQDLTPAQISILMRQSCSKILVGDSHQQVYSFRGAVDALDKVKNHVSATLHLTQSFRFGPEIAYVVSCLLDELKHERRRTIIGGLQDGGVDGKQEGKLAIVSRNNETLFDQMVDVCRNKPPSVKIGFSGGREGYGLDMVLDVYRLNNERNDEIQDKLIKKFYNLAALKKYAGETRNFPLKRSISICEMYGDEIPQLVDNIEERTTRIDRAEIVFSTGHKAKGLEFDTVKVTDDIMNEEYQSKDADHKNLVYVVTTRATKRLILPQVLVDVLHKTGEDFIFPVPPSKWLKQPIIDCPICEQKKPTPALQFEKLALKLADGKVIPGGIICKHCLGQYLPFMKPVLKMARPKKQVVE